MRKRTIIVHGSRATLDGLMSAISADAVSWDVYRNGRKVFSSPGPDAAINYVADESAMNKHTVQMEAMGGSKLIDDGQIAWQIKKSGSAQDSDLFTPSMLEELRREYSQVRSVDPSGEAYQKLTGFLNRMSQPQLRQLAGANIPFLSRLARNRVISKDEAYHTCPECEANFPSSSLISGKLPPHNFLRKPCPGAGRLPTKDSWDLPRKGGPDGPIEGSKVNWKSEVRRDGNQWKYTVRAGYDGYIYTEGWEKDAAQANRAAEEAIKTARSTLIYDHCSNASAHVDGDPKKPVKDVDPNYRMMREGTNEFARQMGQEAAMNMTEEEFDRHMQQGGWKPNASAGRYETAMRAFRAQKARG